MNKTVLQITLGEKIPNPDWPHEGPGELMRMQTGMATDDCATVLIHMPEHHTIVSAVLVFRAALRAMGFHEITINRAVPDPDRQKA